MNDRKNQLRTRNIIGIIVVILCVTIAGLEINQNKTLGASDNSSQTNFSQRVASDSGNKNEKTMTAQGNGQPVAKSTSNSEWIVQSGDSLFSVAKKFGVTVEQIKQKNNLISDRIYVGETLKIPLGSSSVFFYYMVKSGESLYQLALRYGVTVQGIQQINSFESTQIQAGQTIKIPGIKPEQQSPTTSSKKTLAQMINEKGISISKTGLRIFVDKSDKVLSVSAGNVWLKNYHVELGDNGLGDKAVSGDHKTPEGTFYVSEISVLSPTDVYLGSRWMRLSYPNFEDAERGLTQHLIDSATYNQIVTANNQKSIPPQRTALGGGVGIHGGSTTDKGSNWTWGCVGLSDKDVEEIFPYITVGTPVVIQY